MIVNLALVMAKAIGLSAEQFFNSDQEMVKRILTYYVPIALWLENQVVLGKKDGDSDQKRAVCVGLSLPQGGGKTTLTTSLKAGLEFLGIKCAVVSYDDFYLTHDDQQKLTEENPKNFYISERGLAGTHDMELGTKTLQDLINCKESETVTIPQYDKSAFNGQGDRINYEKNPSMKIESGPVDMIIVEGWMLGYQPVDATESKAITDNAGMDFVNEQLKKYAQWDELYDAAILITVDDSNIVFQWREQPEQIRRKAGAGSLTVDEVKTFCSRFIPSYDAYMENMATNGIKGQVEASRTLGFKLEPSREPKVDGYDLSKESKTKIDEVLAKSTGKTELIKYLSENDTFQVKHFTPSSNQNWIKNDFRE